MRRDAFAASRKTVLGDGCPEELVPEAEEPMPESRKESRFDGGDGDGVLDEVCVWGFKFGGRVACDGKAVFFSYSEAVKLGIGSSSLTMIV